MMKNKETQMKWLQNEIKKDQEALEREKLEFINQIKRLEFSALIHSVLHINNWFGIVELYNIPFL